MATPTLPRRGVNATGCAPTVILPFPPQPANDTGGHLPSVAATEWDAIVRTATALPDDGLLFGIKVGLTLANDAIGQQDERMFYRRMLQIYALAARVLIQGGELPGEAA